MVEIFPPTRPFFGRFSFTLFYESFSTPNRVYITSGARLEHTIFYLLWSHDNDPGHKVDAKGARHHPCHLGAIRI